MPIVGYKRGRPDTSFWIEEVGAGIEYRKKTAYEERWKEWRNYYRGNWKSGILPVNLFFMMVRSTVPRLYFRNPSVSLTPTKPGLEHQTLARILERVDNKLIAKMGLKKEVKRVVQDAFMFGTGFLKIGYGAFHTPTPELLDTEDPIGTSGQLTERFEYRTNVAPNMPWAARVQPHRMVVPAGLGVYEETRWICNIIERPLADVKADPRLTNTKDIGPSRIETTSHFGGVSRPQEFVELYEIRDAKTGKVFVIAPSSSNPDDKVIFFDDDDIQINGFPITPLIFNEDDEYFWGIPDSKILEPHQLEINEIRTQQMKHRRLALVKIFVRSGGMDPIEAEKLVAENVSPVIFVNKNPKEILDIVQTSHIPPDLFAANDVVMSDVREMVGFSRNEFGSAQPIKSHAQTSATEVASVQRAAGIRIDERRDMIADMLTRSVETIHQVIFDHWGEEQIVDIVGPGGAEIWVKFSGSLLKRGEYNIKIDPDSAVPVTREAREARAIQLYEILKTNPMLDPEKLTQFLVHELRGPQFDDMMRALPPPEQQPEGPVDPQTFGKIVQQSVQGASRAARPGPNVG